MKNLTLALLAIALSSCSIISPQERGVRLWSGAPGGALDPGMHAWFPVFAGVAVVNVGVQKSDVKTSAASKDMQEVSIEIVVNWSVSPESVVNLYTRLGDKAAVYSKVIEPAVSEVSKAALSKKTAEQILAERISLKTDIDSLLQDRLKAYGVNMLDVSIVNLRFTEQFSHAIEEKQIAEQQSKQSAYLADKAKNDAVARVNQAQGEARAQGLLRETLNPMLVQIRAIEKWDGVLPNYMNGTQGLPFIMQSK